MMSRAKRWSSEVIVHLVLSALAIQEPRKSTGSPQTLDVPLSPGGDKVTENKKWKKAPSPLLSPFPGNIRETWTRLSLSSASHATHTKKKPPVSLPQAAHAKLTCSLKNPQTKPRPSLSDTGRPQTSHRIQTAGNCRQKGRARLYARLCCALTTHELRRPGVHWSRAGRRRRARMCHVTCTNNQLLTVFKEQQGSAMFRWGGPEGPYRAAEKWRARIKNYKM